MSDLNTIARSIQDVLRPRVPIPVNVPNPLHPDPRTWRNRTGGKLSGAAAKVAVSDAPAAPQKMRADYSRVAEVQVTGGGVTLVMRTKPRHTPEQQAARRADAAGILADAVKAAPEGTKIRVKMRDRIIASTDPAEVVTVTPSAAKR